MAEEDVIDRADEVVDAAKPLQALPAVLDPLRTIAGGLDSLEAEAAAVTALDLSTTAGDKAERAFRLKCVTLRADLDRAYEGVNRPLLALQRDARALVADIKSRVLALEGPADLRIKTREAEKEAERVRRVELERQRVAAIRERIDQIAGVARRAVGKPSAEIEAKIRLVVGIEIDDHYGEFRGEAQRVQAETLAALRELLAAAQASEAEAARQQAERERLAREAEFQTRLHNLRAITVGMASRSAEAIRTALNSVEAAEPGDDWGEFRDAAAEARAQIIADLDSMLIDAEARERVAAEQAAEADRLERQRQEQAEAAADLRRRERIAELDRVGVAFLAAVERVGSARADAELARFAPDARGVLSADIDDCVAALDVLQPETMAAPTETNPVAGETNAASGETKSAEPETTGPVDDGVRIKLGDVCSVLGFTVDRAFVEGICDVAAVPAKGRAVLFRACDWPRIVDAIAARAVSLRNRRWS